jgi:hypothetical protein
VERDPAKTGAEVASLNIAAMGLPGTKAMQGEAAVMPAALSYTKFTSQRELGVYLTDHYKIRKPNELSSCEVCHR